MGAVSFTRSPPALEMVAKRPTQVVSEVDCVRYATGSSPDRAPSTLYLATPAKA
jgi:hypothetical protein